MPSGAKTLALSAIVLATGLGLAGQAAAQGAEAKVALCKENEKDTQPASGANPIELQVNKARPTFDVGLADKSEGNDNIFFSPKAGERIDSHIAAELLGTPRAGKHPFHGLILLAAHPSQSARSAVVEACFENVNHWYAGSYEGTIRVYGPQITDFNYALVVTTKWPPWVALVVIFATVIFSVLVLLFLPQVPNPPLKADWRPWLGLFLGIVVAVVLAGLTYFTTYDANDTWGSDPQGQIPALALAAFGATVIGYGVVGSAQKQIGGGGGGAAAPPTSKPGGGGGAKPG